MNNRKVFLMDNQCQALLNIFQNLPTSIQFYLLFACFFLYIGLTMKYANVLTSAVCVDPGVPNITLVIVKLVALLIVYVSSPNVVEAATPILCRNIKSPVAIFVF